VHLVLVHFRSLQEEAALEDSEPFWLDKLQQYQLRERLLRYQRLGMAETIVVEPRSLQS
jgi:exonuclease V gamma subunit